MCGSDRNFSFLLRGLCGISTGNRMKIISPGRLALFVAFHLVFFSIGLRAADPFAEGVRSTEPLTPEQEQKSFHLPPGFTIQLVATEPDLRKPMNMQWDALGRLWITESREYPFPVKDGSPGRDSIRIFSDFAPDGRARKT